VGEEDYRWPELQRLMRAFSPTLYTPLWQARVRSAHPLALAQGDALLQHTLTRAHTRVLRCPRRLCTVLRC
jgi:hypothetical protein